MNAAEHAIENAVDARERLAKKAAGLSGVDAVIEAADAAYAKWRNEDPNLMKLGATPGEIWDMAGWVVHNDRPGREEPEPARWLQRKRNGYAVLVCSNCEREKEGYSRTAYCPNCGRPMTGGEAQG